LPEWIRAYSVLERWFAKDASGNIRVELIPIDRSELIDTLVRASLTSDIRQWCGFDASMAERDKRIEVLERLVWDAIYALQKAGLNSEAIRLRQTLNPD